MIFILTRYIHIDTILPMAKPLLPKQIDPFQLAVKDTTLEGDLPLSEMLRLKDFLCEKDGVVGIHLEFSRNAQGQAFMKGRIKTCFKVICQRCSAPMSLTLDISVNDRLVRSDKEAERLPERYEPLIVDSELMSLSSLVEEEILLSIPIVPKHSIEECGVKSSDLTEFEEQKDELNPFVNLKKLLRE